MDAAHDGGPPAIACMSSANEWWHRSFLWNWLATSSMHTRWNASVLRQSHGGTPDSIRLVGVHAYHLTTIRQKVLQPVEGSVMLKRLLESIHQNEMVNRVKCSWHSENASERRHDPDQEHWSYRSWHRWWWSRLSGNADRRTNKWVEDDDGWHALLIWHRRSSQWPSKQS